MENDEYLLMSICWIVGNLDGCGLDEIMSLDVVRFAYLTGVEVGLKAVFVGLNGTPLDQPRPDAVLLVIFVDTEKLEH